MKFRTDRLAIRLGMTAAAVAVWMSGITVPGVIGSSRMAAAILLTTAWLANFAGSPTSPSTGKGQVQAGGGQPVRLEPEPTNMGAVMFIVFMLLLVLGGGLAFVFVVLAAMGGCCR